MVAHALLSASSGHRWLKCTVSARLEEGMPERTSAYAEEGTLAHACAEAALTGAPMPEGADSEMERYAARYADYIDALREPGDSMDVELRVRMDRWVPEAFGTCDCLLAGKDRITVVDFKYGQGVEVGVEYNPQLMLYALGALDHLEDMGRASCIKACRLCVFQPRIGNISEWEIPTGQLLEWGEEYLRPRAERAYRGLGEPWAGDHCRFCRFLSRCTAWRAWSSLYNYKDVKALTPKETADVLKMAKGFRGWLDAVEDRAKAMLSEDPGSVPGFKLGMTKGRRKVVDEPVAIERLVRAGYALDAVAPRKLKGLTDLKGTVGPGLDGILGDALGRTEGVLKLEQSFI